jgi:hypothetical protein
MFGILLYLVLEVTNIMLVLSMTIVALVDVLDQTQVR